MKSIQEKVENLITQNKTLDETKNEFETDKSALVEIIFNEIKNK